MSERKRRLIIESPCTVKNVISYGLIVYALKTERCVIVQRRHSVEFLLFMNGLYRATYLHYLLSFITENEKNVILECLRQNKEFFSKIYLELNLEEKDLEYSYFRMLESKTEVLGIFNNVNLSKNTLKWSWPKGRISHNIKETQVECAKREFLEEVEVELPDTINKLKLVITESMRTLSGINIESRFILYVIKDEFKMVSPLNNSEVSNRDWVDLKTCEILLKKQSVCELRKAICNIEFI